MTVNIDTARLDRRQQFLSEIGVKYLAFYADPTADVFQTLKRAGKVVGLPTSILINSQGCEIGALAGAAKWDSPDARKLISMVRVGSMVSDRARLLHGCASSISEPPGHQKRGQINGRGQTRTVSPEARRPLSPHLQIYRPLLTMTMSIVHRITGGALYFGTLLLAWWLIAAATGTPAPSTTVQWFMGSLARPADPVRLHLGADPPHARRHPASRLGHRAAASAPTRASNMAPAGRSSARSR